MSAPVPVIEFTHRHAGHCESGVMASLLSHAGLEVSEPMVLGLSAGLTFAHFPFIKIGGLPLTSYRMPPGAIARGLARRVGFKLRRRRFRSPHDAIAALDAMLAAGQPDTFAKPQIAVVTARQNRSDLSRRLQFLGQITRRAQGDFFLQRAGFANRPRILAAMAGIDKHNPAPVLARWDCLGGRNRRAGASRSPAQ